MRREKNRFPFIASLLLLLLGQKSHSFTLEPLSNIRIHELARPLSSNRENWEESLEERREGSRVRVAGLSFGAAFVGLSMAGEGYLIGHPGASGPVIPMVLLAVTTGAAAAVGAPLLEGRLPLESTLRDALTQGETSPRDLGLLGAEIGRGLRVQDAGGRGRGLFATEFIADGSYLMDYRGDVITLGQFLQRYPSFVGTYVFEVGPETFIDAADPKKSNIARFMNHGTSAQALNVKRVRRKWPQEPRVLFFAARDIEAGEELCFDYGNDYWEGREDFLV